MLEHLISIAYAQSATGTDSSKGVVKLANPLGTTSIPVFLGNIISAALGILGSLAFLAFVYGGFLWLTSAGDSHRVDAGKKVMIYSAIGIIIIFGAVGLVRLAFKVVTGS